MLVISSLNVLVNQTITMSCLFETGQKGVLFQFPDNIYCAAQYSVCSMTCGTMSLDCPNNQTYRLNATVSLYWYKKQFYCEGIYGGQQSNPVTLDITGKTLLSARATCCEGNIASLLFVCVYVCVYAGT